jgi:hypothetical protein
MVSHNQVLDVPANVTILFFDDFIRGFGSSYTSGGRRYCGFLKIRPNLASPAYGLRHR